jgi:hypothetical protein
LAVEFDTQVAHGRNPGTGIFAEQGHFAAFDVDLEKVNVAESGKLQK